jgi:hypothetical protein
MCSLTATFRVSCPAPGHGYQGIVYREEFLNRHGEKLSTIYKDGIVQKCSIIAHEGSQSLGASVCSIFKLPLIRLTNISHDDGGRRSKVLYQEKRQKNSRRGPAGVGFKFGWSAANSGIRRAGADHRQHCDDCGHHVSVVPLYLESVSGGIQVVADREGNAGVAINVGGNPGYAVFGAGAIGGVQASLSTASTIQGLKGFRSALEAVPVPLVWTLPVAAVA